jgi:hypothetical protein
MADPEGACPVCAKPVRPEQPVLFRAGKSVHLGCASRAAVLNAVALEGEARAAKDRAARLAEAARRIVENVRRRHRTGDPDDPPAP